jgi:hypothetical protein
MNFNTFTVYFATWHSFTSQNLLYQIQRFLFIRISPCHKLNFF